MQLTRNKRGDNQ